MKLNVQVYTDSFGNVTVYVNEGEGQNLNIDSIKVCLEKEFGKISIAILQKGDFIKAQTTNAHGVPVPDEALNKTVECK